MDPLVQERKNKLQKIQELGIEPYAQKFSKTHSNLEAKSLGLDGPLRETAAVTSDPQNNIQVAGRLMTFRSHGKLSFGQLQDESGRIQICFIKGKTKIKGLNEEQMTAFKFWEKMIDWGDFLGITGELFKTNHGEITVFASEITFLAKSLRPLPEKFHGINNREICYRQRYLDLVMNQETLERFKLRSILIKEIRNFFEAKNFYEVETRTLQSQAGGAMARVFETHHNALDQDFVLRIALELDLKICLAGGIERVFEIGKCFRNEGMDPSHLQEFTMLEWYAAYADLEQNLAWTEELLQVVIQNSLKKTKVQVKDKLGKEVIVDFAGSYPRVTFAELLAEHAKVDIFSVTREQAQKLAVTNYSLDPKEAEKASKGTLLDHIYKKTARPKLIQPTFVTNYPSDLKPLARPLADGTSESAQLLVAGWEITNAYGELINPITQRELLEKQAQAKAQGDAEAMEVDEDFLLAMEHGMPPMTGFGMGIDRLVALLSEQENLRDVVLFPTLKPSPDSK
jgi:lysyl-tRNA synthetase class 2